ncbi:ABC transporter substrate-binding protein [Breoghania sp.]|uniref:ABC transporter substrate-binding protein n=1 Tax=Breoghania sp. TaxID=2065378 RepID=UPI002AA785B1|nr:ABC transporter substrate-binding protein [Breoghania sp.]
MIPLSSLKAGAVLAALALVCFLPAKLVRAQEEARPASLKPVPERVVSINVCTDQLAMLISAPGQLKSVSRFSRDPEMSAMTRQAQAYPLNHAQAEEVFLMRPDVVLASAYTSRTTVTLLRRLGFQVEEFQPATSFDDIRANIRRMGTLLGREARAEELVAQIDEDLAHTVGKPSGKRAALVFANSFTAGSGTLTQAIVEAAGLSNVAAETGVVGSARMPLESLIMANPDLVVSGVQGYRSPARANEIFLHPAYRELARRKGLVSIPSRYWVCGGPFTSQAVRILRAGADAPKALAGRQP